MSTKKRRRDSERRRHERWLARQEEKRAQRRQQIKYGGIIGGLAIALGLAWLIVGIINAPDPSGGFEGGINLAEQGPDDPGNPCALPTNVVTSTAYQTDVVPDKSIAEGRKWTATMQTSCGDIVIELDGEAAPQGVASFIELARGGFYDNTACHRLTVSGIFVLQCGDPTGTGMGSPGYSYGPIENAPENEIYPAGTVAMARIGGQGESMGSQFFLVYEDSEIPADGAGGYTVLGQITSGLGIVETIAEGGTKPYSEAPTRPIAIEKVTFK